MPFIRRLTTIPVQSKPVPFFSRSDRDLIDTMVKFYIFSIARVNTFIFMFMYHTLLTRSSALQGQINFKEGERAFLFIRKLLAIYYLTVFRRLRSVKQSLHDGGTPSRKTPLYAFIFSTESRTERSHFTIEQLMSLRYILVSGYNQRQNI